VLLREDPTQWEFVKAKDMQHSQMDDVPVGRARDEGKQYGIRMQYLSIIHSCFKECSGLEEVRIMPYMGY
jgi:hypothetical protein